MQPFTFQTKSTTMSQEEFIQLFVLRAVSTSPSFGDDFSDKVAQATRAANQAWFTMSKHQSAKISESHPMMTNPSREQETLPALIRVAATEGYNYIAQDSDDLMWYAYENLPRYTGSSWNAKGRYKELISTPQTVPTAQSLTKISDILADKVRCLKYLSQSQ